MNIVKAGHEYNYDAVADKNSIILNIKFQDGTVPDVGRNGWQNEELLEVLINRMNYLQDMFACRENAIAITKLQEALMCLKQRTSDRIKRNVEGQHVK